jgi:hypothetical protein
MKKIRCDYCNNIAHYRHAHVLQNQKQEMSCEQHSCSGCQPMSKKAKYNKLAVNK